MAKKDRPAIENPLANIGLDDIVRNITASGNIAGVDKKDLDKEPDTPQNTGKPRRGSRKLFEDNLTQYTGISEQGIAIWLPKDVKKKLEMIRINASRNIPLRSLAAAIIMTYISENEDRLNNL